MCKDIVLKENKFIIKGIGWLTLVAFIAIFGAFVDYQGNSYTPSYETINIATGNNTTDQKLIISQPASVQLFKLFANFCYGLAVTIFATVFVANKLESEQRKKNEKELEKLRDSVNINVFDALFKTLIPQEIFDIVKSEIIENKSIRKKAHWGLVFEVQDNKIKMTATTHYELHNISKHELENPVNIEIKPLSSSTQTVKLAKCISSQGNTIVEYNENDKSNNKNIEIQDLMNGDKKISYTVTVPPNDFITSTFEYYTIYDDKIYDCQHTRYPIIDLSIHAVFPPGYEFDIYPSLSNELKLITEGPTHKTYKVEGGILPRQGIIYMLNKKQS